MEETEENDDQETQNPAHRRSGDEEYEEYRLRMTGANLGEEVEGFLEGNVLRTAEGKSYELRNLQGDYSSGQRVKVSGHVDRDGGVIDVRVVEHLRP